MAVRTEMRPPLSHDNTVNGLPAAKTGPAFSTIHTRFVIALNHAVAGVSALILDRLSQHFAN